MDTSFEYSAFISYKREDEKWAVWLQNSLERYSIPASIRKEVPRLPKHIKPVFRDKTDLGVGGLTTSLHQELERSHFLIVICSPHSASSEWVGKEISYFKDDLGRENLIIPFIVDGVPHCEDKAKECFHPIFKEFKDEPLGININEIGKQQALIKVLSKILDLKFDSLWRRHKRHIRKKRINFSLAFLLLCCIGLLYWNYKKPMYKYYADYVDKWGIPEGVFEIDKSVLKHRSRAYRFDYRRIPIGEENAFSWRLAKVEYINSAGQPQDHYYVETDNNNRSAILKLEYNSSGTIKHIDLCNKTGKIQVRWKISSHDGEKATLIDFLGTSDYDASGYLSSMSNFGTMGIISKSSIKRYVLKRDYDGYIIEQSFHSNNSDDLESSKITDENGIYKQVFINDSLGRVLTTTFFDINEVIIKRKDGVAIREYEFDNNGGISQISYYNSDQQPTINELLYSKIVFKSDEWGNIIKESYYGIDGRLCYNKDNVSQKIVEFDNNGFPLSIAFLDANNLPCFNNEGVSKTIIQCNSRGDQIENRFEGINGKSCTNKNGFARIEVDYNRWGSPTYMAFYGLDGNLTRNENGISGWTAKYDRFGNCIQYDHFDNEWNKCSDIHGVSEVRNEFDKRGLVIKSTFYDIYGKECACNLGYSSCEYKYYDNGNLKEYSYFENGLPCRIKNGYHKVVYDYNLHGNITEYKYYDTEGALCNCNEGFAICKVQTDSIGNVIQWNYYDFLKHPTRNTDGIEMCKQEFDEQGRLKAVRFYYNEGLPMLNAKDEAGRSVKRDNRGNIIESCGVGIDGNICCDNTGVAKWKAKFDERGNQTLYATYDEKGNLVSLKNGIALWESEYNERGLLIKSSFYDENKKPCINSDVSYSFYIAKYDERCNLIEECTYNEKNQLCINPATGYARWAAKYDDMGNRTEMYSYSENDSLCVCKFGYAKWIAKYDKDGYFEKSISFDANGNVIFNNEENKEQVGKEVKEYDSHRFRFDKTEVVFAFIFLLAILFFLIVWIINISTNTKWENIGWIAGFVFTFNVCFDFLRDFLLHYKCIPYNIYNYSWILYILSAIICVSTIVFFLVRIGAKIISIYRAPKHSVFSFFNDRRQVFRESIGELVFQIITTAFFTIALSYLAYEGWMIYSNPL
jgi:hypothetical protein